MDVGCLEDSGGRTHNLSPRPSSVTQHSLLFLGLRQEDPRARAFVKQKSDRARIGQIWQLQGNELPMVSEDQGPHRVGRAHVEFKGSLLLTWELRDTSRSVQRKRTTSESRRGKAWTGEG